MHVVPEGWSDEQALLMEPLSCAVHTALRAGVKPERPGARVSGAGSVGLFATLALRQLTPAGEIIVVAKHGHQRDLALEFGATEVVQPGRGAAPGTPLDRRLPAQAGVLRAVPPRRRRRRRGRGRQQAVAGDRAQRHPGRRPGGAVRDAGGRRPERRVVPRARGGRHLRLVPAASVGRPRRLRHRRRAGRARARRPAVQVRRVLPAAPVAGGARPRARGRPARYGQGRVRPKEVMDP